MKILILFAILLIISCDDKQMMFSIEAWNYKEDTFFVKRKYLIQDLMNNKLSKGMSFNSGVQLLGAPSDYNNTPESIEYEIEEKYGWNIDPVRGSYLAITIDKDSIVKAVELVKWKN